ncbi:F-box domain containing protein [Tanacetum coccineum]
MKSFPSDMSLGIVVDKVKVINRFPSDMSLGKKPYHKQMADVARAHGGDGGGEDPSRPPPTSFGCEGCFINRGKWKGESPNLRNLDPHMNSERWPRIEGYIQAQSGGQKPDEFTDDEWEKYINFWNDPANAQRAETNRLNRSKSTVVSRHGSRSIPLTRHLMKMTSATQEEPSEIDTFYRLHTVNGVFQDPEALRMYDRMMELQGDGWSQRSGGVLRVDGDDTGVRMWRLTRNFSLLFPSTCRWGNILPPVEPNTLTKKYVGPHFSLGIVAGERFAIELTPSTFPQRHFAGDMFPQRHVAGKRVGMLLGKALNVVVTIDVYGRNRYKEETILKDECENVLHNLKRKQKTIEKYMEHMEWLSEQVENLHNLIDFKNFRIQKDSLFEEEDVDCVVPNDLLVGGRELH